MNGIGILNPLSNRYHALADFKKLTLAQKIVTIAVTIIAALATAFIATAAVFRSLVGHFAKVLHPTQKKEELALPENPKTPKLPLAHASKKGANPQQGKAGTKDAEKPATPSDHTKIERLTQRSDAPSLNAVTGAPHAGEMPGATAAEVPSIADVPSFALDENQPLIPFFVDEDTLLPLEQEARKAHQIAPYALDPSGSVARAVEIGLRQGLIEGVERYDVDHPITILQGGESLKVQIVGTCLKAHMKKDGANRWAYLIAATIGHGAETRRLEIAFSSPKDANDTVAIGNLALQHMEKRGRFITGNTISEASANDLSIFRPTADLPQGFMDRIEQLSVQHRVPSPRAPLTIEYRGSLPSKALETDQQNEILQELEESIRIAEQERKALAKAFKEEDSYMKDESEYPMLPSSSSDEETVDMDSDSSSGLPEVGSFADSFVLLSGDITSSVIEKKKDRKELGLEKKHCNIVAYIYHYLNSLVDEADNESKHIQDDDEIAFTGGQIVKAASTEVAKKSYKEFFHILRESYGTVLARRVFGRYRLNKKETITLRDLKKAMVGVASNALEMDLKSLFQHIQNDKPGKLKSYVAGDLLYQMNKELYLQIKMKQSFGELTTEEVNFLHSAFRTVPIRESSFSVSDVLGHLKKGAEAEGGDYLFLHDLSALELMESWNKLDMEKPDLAIGEYAGKSLAYLELKQGLILPMPSLENKGDAQASAPKLYQVAQSLPSKNDAVIAHILAPLNENQSIGSKEGESKKEDMFLVFRGTLPSSGATAGGMSLYRDFHYEGIGRKTYDAREKEIQDMTEQYLARTSSEEVTLRISGHSLGACDTQRGLVSILEKIAGSEEGSPWRKVKNIVVTTFNAPKVNQSVNHRMKEAVKKINGKSIDVNIDLKHIRFFDKSYEDSIQKFGDILLGADYHGGTGEEVFKDAKNVKRTIVKMNMDDDQGLAQGFLIRHGYRPFNKALCQVPYTMQVLSTDPAVSENPEKERLEMEREMAGTYYWNESEMGIFSKIVGNVVWYTTWFGLRQPKKVIQATIANAPHSIGLNLTRLWNGKTYAELDLARASSE